MNSILTALQEGRLIELPEIEKEKALEVLAILIEAIPDVGGVDLVAEVMRREKEFNTGLGHGVACPHARIPGDGPLLCAVGWSPRGIDYGASDHQKVHLIVLYCIPEASRSSYLKEMSGLAKGITRTGGIHPFENVTDLPEVRARLLDWVETAIEEGRPDSKARMIRLEERSARAETPQGTVQMVVHRVTLLFLDDEHYYVLGDNEGLVRVLEGNNEAAKLSRKQTVFSCGDYELHVMNSRQLSLGRMLYDCVAVRSSGPTDI